MDTTGLLESEMFGTWFDSCALNPLLSKTLEPENAMMALKVENSSHPVFRLCR